MPRPLPLRRLVTQRLVVVTVLPVAVIAVLIWLVLVPQMRTSISLQQLSLARTVAGVISAHLMNGERQLVALADVMVAEEGLSPAQLTTLLDAGCGEGDLFETIYLVEAAENTIRYIGLARPERFRREDLLGIDLSTRELLAIARQEVRTVWSKTFLSTVSSHLAVALAVPLPGRVIIGEITLDRLSEYISGLPVEAELLTLVIDHQGRIVADSRQKRWGQQLVLASLPPSKADVSATRTARPFSLNGEQMVASMVDVDRLGWKVLVAQPHATAYKPVRAMLLLVAIGLVISLIVSLSLAWFMAKRLISHVGVYTAHAKSIAQGKYDLAWPPARTIEYHELGGSLQSMVRQIRLRERQLMASETNMRITLDSIGDGVITTTTAGFVTRLNPVASDLTGWPSNAAIGRPLPQVFNVVDNETRQKVDNPVDRVLASGEIIGQGHNRLLISRNGREYQIADSGAPIRHPDGQIAGVVLVFRDVTEHNRLQELMIQSEKMLTIGGLAAGMAHEINNPLAGILQNAEVLINRLATDLPANRKAADAAGIRMEALQHYLELRKLPEMVADIRKAGLRATTIVKNMLGFARQSDRSVSSHDICALLDRSIELVETDIAMKKRYDFKKIRIHREYEAVDLQVLCEAGKIQQVFLNLLKNGAEAMAGIGAANSGKDVHKSPQFIIRVKTNGQWGQVEIEDNGPGIDAKTRRRVFEPFFTTKPVGQGTGLGLSVSYFIITEDHGGEMTVEPAQSGGTRFIIRLPKSG